MQYGAKAFICVAGIREFVKRQDKLLFLRLVRKKFESRIPVPELYPRIPHLKKFQHLLRKMGKVELIVHFLRGKKNSGFVLDKTRNQICLSYPSPSIQDNTLKSSAVITFLQFIQFILSANKHRRLLLLKTKLVYSCLLLFYLIRWF